MGSGERREREKRARVELILDAAEQTIGDVGLEGVTMQRIAEAAEFTKPTLYIYFRNKDDLLHALICRGLDALLAGYRAAAMGKGNAAARLAGMRDVFREFFAGHGAYFHLMHHEEEESLAPDTEPSPHFIRSDEQTRELFGLIGDTIAAGAADGSLRADLDPLATAIAFWAHCVGLHQLLHGKGDLLTALFDIDPIEARRRVETLFDRSLRPDNV